MEQDNLTISLLELIERPAFCVQDGVVAHANRSAQQIQITPGLQAEDLFPKNSAYWQYNGSQLSLTVLAAGVPCLAQLSRIGDYDVFVLDAENPELRAIALAAQHLRSPLSTVMTVADRLNAENTDQEVTFSHLQRGLHQLHRIICNMSDSYRYQHTSALHMETTDITGVFSESMEAISTHLNDAGVPMRYIGPDRSVIGLVDREMLERAIYNLISNAVKFMQDGTSLEATLALNNNLLSFTVQNQAQDKSNPFSRFLREPGAEDGRHGIGLGMELIRAVAASHGGTVLIDQPDNGLFRITMTLSVTTNPNSSVHSTIKLPISNYAGGRSRSLLELSEVLPANAYEKTN